MNTLTKRQLQLLILAANGHTSQEIANKCYISIGTVHKAMWDVRDRMGTKTTGQAVLKAIAYDLIVIDREGVASAAPTSNVT